MIPLSYFLIAFCYSAFLFLVKRNVFVVFITGLLWPVTLPMHIAGYLDLEDE